MKFDFEQRQRMEDLVVTGDTEELAELIVVREAQLRHCRAETLREARAVAIRFGLSATMAGAPYTNRLYKMAEEAEKVTGDDDSSHAE